MRLMSWAGYLEKLHPVLRQVNFYMIVTIGRALEQILNWHTGFESQPVPRHLQGCPFSDD